MEKKILTPLLIPMLSLILLISPQNSISAPKNQKSNSEQKSQAKIEKKLPPKKKKKKAERLEWGALPAISGNTDIGFGFGIIANIAKYQKGYYPYRWRLEVLWFMTVKEAPGGGVEFPYHDDYISLDMPGLAGGKLRLEMKFAFGRYTTSGYYGLGNNSKAPKVWENFNPETQKEEYILARRRYQYDRIFPNIRINARINLTKILLLFVGSEFTYNWLNFYPKSKLVEDLKNSRDPNQKSQEIQAVRNILLGTEPHPDLLFRIGLVFDNRDHETTPSKGMFHDISLQLSPGTGMGMKYAYGGFTLHTRFFLPIYKKHLVLAARFLTDLLFGQVPFYQLATSGGLYPIEATGGSKSIRGVPSRRYHGKIKILSTIEIRSMLLPWNIKFLGQIFNVGLNAFIDVGRVWTDYAPYPELDEPFENFKIGFGGGLRLLWGENFIIRADVGYSPGNPLGIYIGVGQVF